ncbi:MAG: FGGY-family carbohydrate kinase [Puniceicoccaceae bacterium]
MPEGKYLLGIDNGGTLSKAALFTFDGDELTCSSRKVEQIELHPGWSERDAKDMWQGTAEAVREVITSSGIDAADIAAVACTGHGNGLYLVDESGNPVRNAINSTDSRASAYVDRWLADGIDEKVLPLTTQCVWPAQPNALLAWLRDNEPKTMERARWVLFAKDFVRTQLTGEIWMEETDMSGSSLMNVVTGQYDEAVLELFGIGEMQSLLPPLRKSHELCGKVTAEAAALTGLAEGTPVAGGMFDIDACGLASGIVDEGQMSLVAGTWGNNQYISREPLIDKDLFMTSRYCIPGWYLMLEGSPTSASNLEWFVSRFLGEGQSDGKSLYRECDEAVAATRPDDADIVFLPFLFGSNESSSAKSSFLGLENQHTRGDVLRAVYEGIVFSHNYHLQRLLQFRDKPDCIRFTGGAARSEVWVQMFADCFQIPVEIPAGTELGALGAAIAAAVAVGVYPDYLSAVNAMTKISRRHEPDPDMAGIYQEKYARYRKAIQTLDALWN